MFRVCGVIFAWCSTYRSASNLMPLGLPTLRPRRYLGGPIVITELILGFLLNSTFIEQRG